jgi:hypothetical protein
MGVDPGTPICPRCDAVWTPDKAHEAGVPMHDPAYAGKSKKAALRNMRGLN